MEWKRFCKGQMPDKGMLPTDIPKAPQHTYKSAGWKGYGDWLAGTIAHKDIVYRPFGEARAFVHSLMLKGVDEWYKFCRGQLPEKGLRPVDIPSKPERTYSGKGWIGYGDWLGTGAIANFNKTYRSFEEARAFVHSLKLKSAEEWNHFCRGQMPEKGIRPPDIPTTPSRSYAKTGWIGLGDWLGTGTIATREIVYRPFDEAREFVHALKLKSQAEWDMYRKGQMPEKGLRPCDIPANPRNSYAKSGWKGLGDWLGTGTIATFIRVYRPFEEAREFVHSLKLKNTDEWKIFCKGQMPEKGTRPSDIPVNPNNTYAKSGWKGMGDWLGTGAIANFNKCFRPFKEARAFAHSLKLKNQKEWYNFCKNQMPEKGMRPADIPANPNLTYKSSGWKGMSDWLGKK